jgi:hypothetical protein
VQNTELHLGNPCNQLAKKLIFANSPHSVISLHRRLLKGQDMNFWPRFPNLFRLERGPFANKVTSAPSTSPKQQLRKEIPAFHVNKNNGRGNFHFNLGKNLGGKSLQTPQAKNPLFMRPPIQWADTTSGSSIENAASKRALYAGSGAAEWALPSGTASPFTRLTFDNSSHALCFIRAAIAGDYNTAQIATMGQRRPRLF